MAKCFKERTTHSQEARNGMVHNLRDCKLTYRWSSKQQEETQLEVRLQKGAGSWRPSANLLMGFNFVLTLTGSHEMISGIRVSHQICILEELFQQQSQV